MADFDLIVIGSGPAGEKGAAQAAYFGKRVALVEQAAVLGGASANTGTLPSKTLRESALFLSGLSQRDLYGVRYTIQDDVTIGTFMYREERVVAKQRELVQQNLARHGVALLRGRATLDGAHSLRVEDSAGVHSYTADVILIATGSHPYRPAHVPFDDRRVCDSDSILRLDRIPASLVIVGGGVIGSEYACLFAALGVRVTLTDARDRVLPFLDSEIVGLLAERMRALGIDLRLGVEVAAITASEAGVRTALNDGRSVDSEALLFAAGRSGNVDGLNLDGVGVTVNARGHIHVNEHYQTSVPSIYAAGDVIGFPALAATAMEQARLAMCHAFRLTYKTQLAAILPYGIYTIPEISAAGASEDDLRHRGIPYEVGRAKFGNNARGMIIGDTEGLLKLVFDPHTQRLLGVHIIGEDATELVHIGISCMYYQGTIDSFIQSAFNYPTLSEAYKYAAYDGLGNLARHTRS